MHPLFLIIFSIGVIITGLYFISYRNLVIYLQSNHPEKWKALGELEFASDEPDDLKNFIRFLKSPDYYNDQRLLMLKSKTKRLLITGLIMIGGSLSYLVIKLVTGFNI